MQNEQQNGKSPIISALLSIFPGLGQLYTGNKARGAAFFIALALLIPLIVWKGETALLGPMAVVWLWNIWDAYNLAQGKEPSLLLPALAIALTVYVIGWRVTRINLERLLTDVADIRPLVTSLLKPAVLARDIEEQVGYVALQIPCSENPPPKEEPPAEGPYLALITQSTCGNPLEDRFVVEGRNLWPSSFGSLWWADEIGMEWRVRQEGRYVTFNTDEQGKTPRMIIIATEPMPEARGKGPRPYRLEARLEREVGSPHLSETFFLVLEKMTETVFLALMATTLAITVAIPVSFLAARNMMGGNPMTLGVYYAVRSALNILRAIEPLIMAIIFVVWVGLGPFAGVLALTIHSIAALGKLYSEAVESIDPRPIEAVLATGANRWQMIAYAVIPQIVPPYLAFTIYRWDINVRMSTIIGFVGGGGIGFLLQQWIRLLMYKEAGAAVWAIAIVVAIMDYVSARVREEII
jgi:phosphonate transport system permease protein